MHMLSLNTKMYFAIFILMQYFWASPRNNTKCINIYRQLGRYLCCIMNSKHLEYTSKIITPLCFCTTPLIMLLVFLEKLSCCLLRGIMKDFKDLLMSLSVCMRREFFFLPLQRTGTFPILVLVFIFTYYLLIKRLSLLVVRH